MRFPNRFPPAGDLSLYSSKPERTWEQGGICLVGYYHNIDNSNPQNSCLPLFSFITNTGIGCCGRAIANIHESPTKIRDLIQFSKTVNSKASDLESNFGIVTNDLVQIIVVSEGENECGPSPV